jgi:hypothetical protein
VADCAGIGPEEIDFKLEVEVLTVDRQVLLCILDEFDGDKVTTYTSQPKHIDTVLSEHGIATERSVVPKTITSSHAHSSAVAVGLLVLRCTLQTVTALISIRTLPHQYFHAHLEQVKWLVHCPCGMTSVHAYRKYNSLLKLC